MPSHSLAQTPLLRNSLLLVSVRTLVSQPPAKAYIQEQKWKKRNEKLRRKKRLEDLMPPIGPPTFGHRDGRPPPGYELRPDALRPTKKVDPPSTPEYDYVYGHTSALLALRQARRTVVRLLLQ